MTFSYAYSLKNSEVTLTNCDREPVHVPGCIQPFGVLLVINPKNLSILQVSDNAGDWLGKKADSLLSKPIAYVFGADNAKLLNNHLSADLITPLPKYLFTFEAHGKQLDVLIHLHDGVLIAECEASSGGSKAQGGPYAEVNRTAAQLMQAQNLEEFCTSLAKNIRAITGLDRVMIYRFHPDQSGEVFAEAKRDDLHSYYGLHYPSEDIPQPAREIFRKIWVRPVPDVSYRQCELVPLLNPETQKPLDMTYCFLRGASIMYTDYLKNMGVAMALTLSIVIDGQLWGLIACHHYSPKVIAWPERAACELLSQIASLQLKAVEARGYAAYRKRMERTAQNLVEAMLADGLELHELFNAPGGLFQYIDADGIALFQNSKWTIAGETPTTAELTALSSWIVKEFEEAPLGTEVIHTHALSESYPPAESYAEKVSGLLAMPVSRHRDEFIVWFRKEVVQTVNWAGDPHSKKIVDGPGSTRLMPRASFEIWCEQLRGHSLPWLPVEMEAARRLRLVIMEVVVARSQSVARLNRELTASNQELDAFAYITSHDLREPLRGIYHYAHYLREDAAKRDDAGSTQKADSLLRLTKRMDNLIESLLHLSRLGRATLQPEPVDMEELIEEVTDIVRASRASKNPSVRVVTKLPKVNGDSVRLRELWLNIIGNAIKYNESPAPLVEVGCQDGPSGPIFFARDNGIGIPKQSFQTVFQMFKRLHGKEEYGGGSGAGLSIAQKIVERHDGKIWIESEDGKGSTFFFTIGHRPS